MMEPPWFEDQGVESDSGFFIQCPLSTSGRGVLGLLIPVLDSQFH